MESKQIALICAILIAMIIIAVVVVAVLMRREKKKEGMMVAYPNQYVDKSASEVPAERNKDDQVFAYNLRTYYEDFHPVEHQKVDPDDIPQVEKMTTRNCGAHADPRVDAEVSGLYTAQGLNDAVLPYIDRKYAPACMAGI